MCSLEIVINSSWTSEITPKYTVENANCCTVILKLSVKISVGSINPCWVLYKESTVLYLSPMGILSSSKYEIIYIFLSGKWSFKILPQHFNPTWVLNCHCHYHVIFMLKLFFHIEAMDLVRKKKNWHWITVLFVLTAIHSMFL